MSIPSAVNGSAKHAHDTPPTHRAKPTALPLLPASVPAELQALAQWVVWDFVLRDGKPTKPPRRADNGDPASSTDPATWASFDHARAAQLARSDSGIGFVFTASDPYCGIDLDDCRDPNTGVIEPEAQAIIDRLASYTEVSPSGTGVKIVCRATLCRGKRFDAFGVEIYDRERYFTITGHTIGSYAIADRQAALDELIAELEQRKAATAPPCPRQGGTHRLIDSDEELIEHALRARNAGKFSDLWQGGLAGCASASEADLALCNLLRWWCGPDAERIDRLFRASGRYRSKWDRDDYRKRTIAKALEVQQYYDPKRKEHTKNGYVNGHANKPADPSDSGDGHGDAWEDPRDRLRHAAREVIRKAKAAQQVHIERYTMSELLAAHPALRPPLVEGLLRQGETCNVIAAPKAGKSWLSVGLAFAVATGQDWLKTFRTDRGRVLLIDNELHKETLAHRLRTVATQANLAAADVGQSVEVVPLRGQLKSIDKLDSLFGGIKPGEFRLVILDAFYRALPAGCRENENEGIKDVYNLIDHYAAHLQSAFVNIHHASKGNQSGKSVTDTGSGAGSLSRAADTHLVLRQHEEPDAVVLEAALRSFPPIEPLCLRWSYPFFEPAKDLDPAKLKESTSKATVGDNAQAVLQRLDAIDPQRRGVTVQDVMGALGWGRDRVNNAVAKLVEDNLLERVPIDRTTGNGVRKTYEGYRRAYPTCA